MKIAFIDREHVRLYINKEYKKIDKNNIYENIKDLFFEIEKIYEIEFNGFYLVTIYEDKYYGILIDIKKEDIDYYDYYDNQINMKIVFKETEFLYQIDDYYYFNNQDYLDIIFIDEMIYGRINKKISKEKIIKLLEMTNEIRV